MKPLAARRRERRIPAFTPILIVLAFAAAPAPARAGCGGHVAGAGDRLLRLTSQSVRDALGSLPEAPTTPRPRCSGPNCSAPADQPPPAPAPSWESPRRIDICGSIADIILADGPSWPSSPPAPVHSIDRAADVDPPPERRV